MKFNFVNLLQTCYCAIITALFIPAASVSVRADEAPLSIRLKIQQQRLFELSFEPISKGETTEADQDFLRLLERQQANPTNTLLLLEEFLREDTSPYVPSVAAGLGGYYRDRGRYTLALNHWANAWSAVKADDSKAAHRIGDYVLGRRAALLASLGRVEELKGLFKEAEGRVMEDNLSGRLFSDAQEGLYMMEHYPETSFRCGTFAMANIVQLQNPTNGVVGRLLGEPSPRNGFSMLQLEELSQKEHLALVAVERPADERQIIVPSLVHWKQNHYAAILRKGPGDFYYVIDPTFGSEVLISAEYINEEASGHFMMEDKFRPQSWKVLTKQVASSIFGKGQPNNIEDWKDEGCPKTPGGSGTPVPAGANCTDCTGMAGWWVTEPYVNLQISDAPLSYIQSTGEPITFQFRHKMRDIAPPGTSVSSYAVKRDIGMTNATLSHNWQSHIMVSDSTYVFGSGLPKYYWGWQAVVYLPEGGYRVYSSTATIENRSYDGLIPNSGGALQMNDNTVAANCGGTGGANGFRMTHPDGSFDLYDIVSSNLTYPVADTVYLSARVDANGRTNRLCYESVPRTTGISYVYRPATLTDWDGRVTAFSYDPTFADLVSRITDPYGRFASFAYDSSGRLTNITDAAGLQSAFVYVADPSGLLDKIRTPYGETKFSYYEASRIDGAAGDQGNAGGHGRINRTITVAEPNGATNLYMFSYDSGTKVVASYPTAEVPVVSGTALDNGTASSGNTLSSLHFRNSFYWGPKQYSALSTAIPANFTAQDYAKGRMRHWLDSGLTGTTYMTDRLSLERAPSADSGGTTEGFKTWYSYDGKASSYQLGNNSLLNWIAMVLPDGTTRYQNFHYYGSGRVQNVTSTFTTNSTVSTRLRSFVYEANQINLSTIFGENGDKEFFATYNANHQPLTITTPIGTTGFTYDNARHTLTLLTFPTGLRRQFSYTSVFTNSPTPLQFQNSARLNNITDLETGRSESFTYTNSLVLAHMDDRGLVTTSAYDGLNRLTNIVYASDNTSNVLVYGRWDGQSFPNSSGGTNILDLTALKDRNGNWTYLAYSAKRQLTSVKDANAHTNTFGYCTCGALTGIQNGAGEIYSFSYDNQLRRTAVTLPDLTSISYGYNYLGQLTSISDTVGSLISSFSYNNQGLLATITNPAGQTYAAKYEKEDRPYEVTDANGVTVTNRFDEASRLLSRVYPDNSTEIFGYTTNFFPATAHTDPLTNTVNFVYDVALRLCTNYVVNIFTNQFGYNGAGDLLKLTNGNRYVTTWDYDSEGRLRTKRDSAGTTILALDYFPTGWLSNRVDANGLTTKFLYDAVGNLRTNVYPGRVEVFTYDNADRLKTFSDPVGASTLDYMTNGWLQAETGPWAAVSYAYTNLLRQKLSIGLPAGGTLDQAYGYDSARRLEKITSPAGAFQNYFQGAGSLIKGITLGTAGSITNSFDPTLARLTATVLKNPIGTILNSHSYVFDVAGQVATNTRPDAKVVFGYDKIGQLLGASGYEANGTTVRPQESFNYGYDPAGNLKGRTNGALNQVFTTDARNRLTGVASSGSITVAGISGLGTTAVTVNEQAATLYSDKTFSRAGVALSEPNFRAVATDSQGRVTRDTVPNTFNLSASPGYDANGNLLRDATRGFSYDEENRLTRVTVTNSATLSSRSDFVYDAVGRRRITREYTSGAESTPFVQSVVTSTLRNDYTGWAGFRFTVGNSPLTVSELGRWVVSGNSGVHTVKLVNASGVAVAGGATVINTAGAAPGQFLYAPLAAPVVLSANTSYYLATQETLGGDQWYEYNCTLSTTSAGTINYAVYSTDSVTFGALGGAGNSYGPVNFKTLGTPLVTGVNLSGTVRNDYSGWAGCRITMGPTPIKVRELGRWVVGGNSGSHTVKIVDASGNDVSGATVSVNTSGAPTNKFAYMALTTPVVLAANAIYYVVSLETASGDKWYDFDSQLTATGAATVAYAVYGNPSTTLYPVGNSGNSYVPVGLTYTTEAWALAKETRYVYDGRLAVQERDGSNQPTVTYTRGLDLSGTRSGAGGIGGLLARTAYDGLGGSSHAYYHSDLGGNVTGMLNQFGYLAAKYIYDAYGNTIAASGTLADANRYRFSSKEVDLKSGIYYYGFRYYDPSIQRWLNEDPIAEAGGLNLHQFVRNSPINFVDKYGLEITYFFGDQVSSPLYPTGGVPYLTGDTPTENVLAGIYNTIPLLQNSLGKAGELVNGLFNFIGDLGTSLTGDPQIGDGLKNVATVVSMLPGRGCKLGSAAKTTPSLEALSQAASAADRGGLTVAGRSLTKHGAGARPGNSLFPAAQGNPAAINQAAQNVVDDILTTPGSIFQNSTRGRFGPTIEVTAPGGRGMVYDANGKFLFFKE